MKKETTLLERVENRKSKMNAIVETVTAIMLNLGVSELSIKIEGNKCRWEMKAANKTP